MVLHTQHNLSEFRALDFDLSHQSFLISKINVIKISDAKNIKIGDPSAKASKMTSMKLIDQILFLGLIFHALKTDAFKDLINKRYKSSLVIPKSFRVIEDHSRSTIL